MVVIYIGLIIILGGIGIVIWLMLSEKPASSSVFSPPKSAENKSPQPSPEEVLARAGLDIPLPAEPKKKPSAGLFSVFKKKAASSASLPPDPLETPKTGTGSLRLDQSGDMPTSEGAPDESMTLESELSFKIDELQAQNREAQEKYQRLEELFNEKGAALEKSENALQGELKARKEFNKVKDILEKELKDSKDLSRKLEGDFNAAQLTIEAQVKRINQLEEKVKDFEKAAAAAAEEARVTQEQAQQELYKKAELEKSIEEKNKKIEELVKRMHELHAAPAASASPPAERPTADTAENPAGADELEPAVQTETPKDSINGAPAVSSGEVVTEALPDSPQAPEAPAESLTPDSLEESSPVVETVEDVSSSSVANSEGEGTVKLAPDIFQSSPPPEKTQDEPASAAEVPEQPPETKDAEASVDQAPFEAKKEDGEKSTQNKKSPSEGHGADTSEDHPKTEKESA